MYKFVIVTQQFEGLGFAKILKEEGNKVIVAFNPKKEDDLKGYDLIGRGIVPVLPLEQVLKKRQSMKDWIFWWDMNFLPEIADKLRKEGFKVLGGYTLSDKSEHDRNFGIELIKRAGLVSPATKEFTNIKEALTFLDANPETAYVFKPDDQNGESWVTTAPENENPTKANRELYTFLKSQKDNGTFLLQEKKTGIEVNIEFLVFQGKPFLAHANFESKKKDNSDLGRMIGCAMDVDFIIPLDSRILKDTLWKLIKLPEFKNYTGRVDLNLIVSDNEYWFLEFCNREGFNASPNMFVNLALIPLGEIIYNWVNGKTDNFYSYFKKGFGSTITCWLDKPVIGLPITFSDEIEKKFYAFDMFVKEGQELLSGYSNEVGIICAHDYDIKSSADEVLENFNKVHYQGKTGRTDINRTDYRSNPQERYIALRAMNLL